MILSQLYQTGAASQSKLMHCSVLAIECFHVTSQLCESHMGGHFGVQLNGDLVCCMMRMQNAAQTWQLMDLPHKYV